MYSLPCVPRWHVWYDVVLCLLSVVDGGASLHLCCDMWALCSVHAQCKAWCKAGGAPCMTALKQKGKNKPCMLRIWVHVTREQYGCTCMHALHSQQHAFNRPIVSSKLTDVQKRGEVSKCMVVVLESNHYCQREPSSEFSSLARNCKLAHTWPQVPINPAETRH